MGEGRGNQSGQPSRSRVHGGDRYPRSSPSSLAERKANTMPRAPRLCSCGKTLQYGQDCVCHPRQRTDTRPSARERGYDREWQKLAAAFLRVNRLCAACGRDGLVVPATCVDHILPVHAFPHLRLEVSNLQALCTSHNVRKGIRERREGGSSRLYEAPGTTARPLSRKNRANSISGTDQSGVIDHEFECEGLGSWL